MTILKNHTGPISRLFWPCLMGLLGAALLSHGTQAQQQSVIPSPPQINGSSYVLMDATTGEILIEHDAHLALPPASLTKIMTDYVAAEELDNDNISLDDQVHVSVRAWRTEGSKMFIQEGTSVRLEDILRGIIIQSGNDASVALAEHVAGSEDAFADMMNQHAQLLGMENSHFTNASGLPHPDHLTSAHDLAMLARGLIQRHPDHYAMYAEKEFTYNDIRQPNRNTLLFRDRNVDGMKTGYTQEAGYCLVASATRDDMRLIAVVMGTASADARAIEAQKMLTYGFRFYETTPVFQQNEELTSQRIWSGRSNSVSLGVEEQVMLTIPRGQRDNLETELELPEVIRAPVEAGQVMGTVRLIAGDQTYYEGPLVSMEAVERGSLIKRFMDWLHLFFLNLFS